MLITQCFPRISTYTKNTKNKQNIKSSMTFQVQTATCCYKFIYGHIIKSLIFLLIKQILTARVANKLIL